MATINDMKKARLTTLLFTGTLNDQELAFFKANGATSSQYNEAKQQWLAAKGFSTGTINDREDAYLKGLGFTGALNDKLYQALVAGTYYA